MTTWLKRTTHLIPLLLLVACSWGQEKASQPPMDKIEPGQVSFKLDFLLSELEDGKKINTRSYSMIVREGEWGKIRLGDRVPVAVGHGDQYQYLDVGTSLDSRAGKELDSGLPLSVTADVSSIVPEQKGESRPAPLIRQLKYQLDAIVPLGKTTLISSADEIVGSRRLQIEVTATKIR